MKKTRVAVIRGGPSVEYDISLITGASVLATLAPLGYTPIDISVTRTGEWLIDGRVKSPDIALQAVDVVFIALHGAYGEDGTVQRLCERLHIPFTGSNSFPSAVAFNKDSTKRTLREHNIKLPRHVRVRREDIDSLGDLVGTIGAAFGPEYVVKPTNSGSSFGVSMVTGADQLSPYILEVLAQYDECMVEERIRGVEATCAILEDFRDTKVYVLPPIEIIPPASHEFYSSDIKIDGRASEICPGRFSYDVKEKIADLGTIVHKALGLSQYSRTDCIVQGDDVYFLEVNTLPGLTPEALYPRAADAVGLSFSHLVDHLIRTARVRPR
jgi:D-alanine-D-alanine ligase